VTSREEEFLCEREVHETIPTPTMLSPIAERAPLLLNRRFIIARVAIMQARRKMRACMPLRQYCGNADRLLARFQVSRS